MIFVLLVAGAFALATLRRYSVAQTITLTSFAFFLTSWLNSASGTSPNDLQFVPNSSDIEPWFQPCGTRLAASRRMYNSSDSNNIMKRVRTQLRVAQNHFNKTFKDVRMMYSKVYRVVKEQYSSNWLNSKKQLDWYYRGHWCLEKGKKADLALPNLYNALRKFSIAFHSLREYHLDSNVDVSRAKIIKKRAKIIDKAHNQVLRLLCEVEAAMINLELRTSTLSNAFIMNMSKSYEKKGDVTLMLIQDWGVIKLYRIFLKDWIKVFRNATTNNTCDRNITTFATNMPKKWLNERGARMPKMRKRKPTRKLGRNNPFRQNSLRKGPQRNRLMKRQKGPTLQT